MVSIFGLALNLTDVFLNNSASWFVNLIFRLSSNFVIFNSPSSSTSKPLSLTFKVEGVNILEFLADSDDFLTRPVLVVVFFEGVPGISTLSSSSSTSKVASNCFCSSVELTCWLIVSSSSSVSPSDWFFLFDLSAVDLVLPVTELSTVDPVCLYLDLSDAFLFGVSNTNKVICHILSCLLWFRINRCEMKNMRIYKQKSTLYLFYSIVLVLLFSTRIKFKKRF